MTEKKYVPTPIERSDVRWRLRARRIDKYKAVQETDQLQQLRASLPIAVAATGMEMFEWTALKRKSARPAME